MSFWVTKTNVIFQKFWTLFCKHHTKENKSTVIKFFFNKTFQSWSHNIFFKLNHCFFRNIIQRTNSAHSTSVRTFCSIHQSFVISCSQERNNCSTSLNSIFRSYRNRCQNRNFNTFKIIFNYNFFTSITNATTIHNVCYSVQGFLFSCSNNNTFSSCQTVCFNYNWSTVFFNIFTSSIFIYKSFTSSTGNTVFFHKVFRQIFTCFKLCSSFFGSNTRNISIPENISQTIS